MNAVDALNQIIDYDVILNHYGFQHVRSDGIITRSCCKIHGGDNPSAFVVNHENKLWFCHTGGCGGGNAFMLVQKLEECTFKEAVFKLAGIFGLNIRNMEIKPSTINHNDDARRWLQQQTSKVKLIDLPEFIVNAETKNVLKFRKFFPSTIELFGMKFVEKINLIKRDGSPYYLQHRLIFPITQNDKQIGISIRKIRAKDSPKWLHQPVNLPTKELLYNYDRAKDSTLITIVEGILDVWAYHEIGIKAVATFGAHITNEQYHLLLKTGSDLVLSFDGDHAGQMARNKAIQLFRNKSTLYGIDFTDGEDPENITREELKFRYENKRRL